MDFNMGSFIVSLIQTILFFTPVIILFYKQGRKDQLLDESVNNLKLLTIEVNNLKNEQNKILIDLSNKIENINVSLVKVTTTIDYIRNDIENIKI